MPIRFACARCGKIHRVPDHYAGRRGTCGRCGLRFTAPGTTPDTANVFVPADDADFDADSDSDPFGIPLTDPPSRSGVRKTLAIGLLAGLMLVAGMFLLRDAIAAYAPGMAPMMPPKAAPPRRAAPHQLAGWLAFEAEATKQLALLSLGLAHLLILVVMPIAVPAFLSRSGVLSVGRWLIMASVSVFFTMAVFAPVVAFSARLTVDGGKLNPLALVLLNLGVYAAATSFFGIPGCLIAAAVHPKVEAPGHA